MGGSEKCIVFDIFSVPSNTLIVHGLLDLTQLLANLAWFEVRKIIQSSIVIDITYVFTLLFMLMTFL